MTDITSQGRGFSWRLIAWGVAGTLLLIPLIAMQFTNEVQWSLTDFLFAGVLIVAVGAAFELFVRMSSKGAYRLGAAMGLFGCFLLVWVNGAVGIIGSENNQANLLYATVLLVGIVGSVTVQFRAGGMAVVFILMALTQGLIGLIAILAKLNGAQTDALELVAINGVFIALFFGAAMLFRQAANSE